MQDFTLTTYKKLIQALLNNGYSFQTLQDFIQRPEPLSRQFWELATKLRSASYARQADTHRRKETAVYAKLRRAKEVGDRRSEVGRRNCGKDDSLRNGMIPFGMG